MACKYAALAFLSEGKNFKSNTKIAKLDLETLQTPAFGYKMPQS